MPRRYTPAEAVAAFWDKVDKTSTEIVSPFVTTPCWTWTGARIVGYGAVKFNRVRWATHRLMWTMLRGPIPDDLSVLHRCDNPPCCNPDHLFLGTNADNRADMVQKGRVQSGEMHHTHRRPDRVARGDRHSSRTHPERVARGEAAGRVKLTEANVHEIRRRVASGATLGDVSTAFGISKSNAHYIVKRVNWGWLPDVDETTPAGSHP